LLKKEEDFKSKVVKKKSLLIREVLFPTLFKSLHLVALRETNNIVLQGAYCSTLLIEDLK